MALFVDAGAATLQGNEIRLDTGDVIRSGVLMDPGGRRRNAERPLQIFTRWYGFALMFPGCEVFGSAPYALTTAVPHQGLTGRHGAEALFQ